MSDIPSPTPHALSLLQQCLQSVPDPRPKKGTTHLFHTILAVLLLGLLANRKNLAEIQRWSEHHFEQLQRFLRFRYWKGKRRVPHAITLARILRKLSLADLQNAFATFINAIINDTFIIAAVDGKAAKQMKDDDGNPILMLNVFAQTIKVHLASWNVRGDKTNEPACLKNHLQYLFEMYPCLKLLTGDAIFAQRPLLEAIREYERDYLVQVKDNQPKVHAKLKEIFADAPRQKPDDYLEIADDSSLPPGTKKKSYDREVNKKRGLWRSVACM
jgi:hypothetical protein